MEPEDNQRAGVTRRVADRAQRRERRTRARASAKAEREQQEPIIVEVEIKTEDSDDEGDQIKPGSSREMKASDRSLADEVDEPVAVVDVGAVASSAPSTSTPGAHPRSYEDKVQRKIARGSRRSRRSEASSSTSASAMQRALEEAVTDDSEPDFFEEDDGGASRPNSSREMISSDRSLADEVDEPVAVVEVGAVASSAPSASTPGAHAQSYEDRVQRKIARESRRSRRSEASSSTSASALASSMQRALAEAATEDSEPEFFDDDDASRPNSSREMKTSDRSLMNEVDEEAILDVGAVVTESPSSSIPGAHAQSYEDRVQRKIARESRRSRRSEAPASTSAMQRALAQVETEDSEPEFFDDDDDDDDDTSRPNSSREMKTSDRSLVNEIDEEVAMDVGAVVAEAPSISTPGAHAQSSEDRVQRKIARDMRRSKRSVVRGPTQEPASYVAPVTTATSREDRVRQKIQQMQGAKPGVTQQTQADEDRLDRKSSHHIRRTMRASTRRSNNSAQPSRAASSGTSMETSLEEPGMLIQSPIERNNNNPMRASIISLDSMEPGSSMLVRSPTAANDEGSNNNMASSEKQVPLSRPSQPGIIPDVATTAPPPQQFPGFEQVRDHRAPANNGTRTTDKDGEYDDENGNVASNKEKEQPKEFGKFQSFGKENLAVAVAIDEDEDDGIDGVLVAAVEYDPDSKPPLTQNRRFKLYGMLCCCIVVVAVIIGAVAGTTGGKSGKTIFLDPTLSPTFSLDTQYRNEFAVIVGEQVFEEGSAHAMAADWIINEDPLKLGLDADNLIQRYALAFLYFHFSAGGTKPWRSCNPPKDGETSECTQQQQLFGNEGLEIVETGNQIRWLSENNECDWVGVNCVGGPSVVQLSLRGFGLSGTLPLEMQALSYLQSLSLFINDITGTIPTEYSKLDHLIELELNINQLTGTIPEELYRDGAGRLLSIITGGNLLSGSISTQIGLLTGLRGYHAFDNLISGSIPSEVGLLEDLAFIRLNNNTLTGSIPPELFVSDSLAELWLHKNDLTGPIPSEIGLPSRLSDIQLNRNMLSGSIPEEIYNLDRIVTLALETNNITGTISTRVGQLTRMQLYIVGRNMLTGTIPTELSALEDLKVLWLSLNELDGSVPDDLCANFQDGVGKTHFLEADCLPFDNPTTECPCCAACCNRETRKCENTF